ncbi:MAG TPA: family 1 glycosylhydrolase, partial [Spirochaetia bacterium]|nr:family 1 glycosylhydrolase [Spirochaetia bacterium]
VEYFTDYSSTLFERLGDRVHLWITHNEPWVTAFLGHADGVHAPGIRSFSVAIQVAHHLILSHARAVQAYRALQAPEGRIGIALSLTPAYPAGDSQEDMEAARRADGFQNRWFLDPVLKGLYPADMMEIYQERYERPVLETGDMDLISRSPCDFLGVNYYTRRIVHNGGGAGPLFETSEPRDCPVTEMGWEVYPEGLYTLLLRLETEYDHPVLFITENGAAFEDRRTAEGRIEDEQRVSFAREHLLAAHRAIQKGVDLQGYYLWSLMDNFEWSHGYSKRFGILYTDYQTQERIWKKSAYWYRDVIRNNGLEESQG